MKKITYIIKEAFLNLTLLAAGFVYALQLAFVGDPSSESAEEEKPPCK